jgi:DNA invertase Pin-like site-specific DNA recombinase
MNGSLRAAIYTRVSTEEQAEGGYSLDSQLERLRAYCFSQQLQVAGEYIDAGMSGRNIKRPQYQRMLSEHEKWDTIVVIKMDRIHRNRLNFIQMMSDLKRQGKEFISMSESLDTNTAMGRFVAGIIQDIAQLESEQLGERTFLGMRQKSKNVKAGYNGHRLPFGYKLHNGRLIEDPEKLAIVKKCFEMYDQGSTLHEIGRSLEVNYSRIQYYLQNPLYAGFEMFCHYLKRADVKPLISIDLFNRVQRLKVSRIDRSSRYVPLQLQDLDFYEIPVDQLKNTPMVTKPKHNFKY